MRPSAVAVRRGPAPEPMPPSEPQRSLAERGCSASTAAADLLPRPRGVHRAPRPVGRRRVRGRRPGAASHRRARHRAGPGRLRRSARGAARQDAHARGVRRRLARRRHGAEHARAQGHGRPHRLPRLRVRRRARAGMAGASDIVLVPLPTTFRILPWSPRTAGCCATSSSRTGRRSRSRRGTCCAGTWAPWPSGGSTCASASSWSSTSSAPATPRSTRCASASPASPVRHRGDADHAGLPAAVRGGARRRGRARPGAARRPRRARPAAAVDRSRVRTQPARGHVRAAGAAARRRRRRPVPRARSSSCAPATAITRHSWPARTCRTSPRADGICTSACSAATRARTGSRRAAPASRCRRSASATSAACSRTRAPPRSSPRRRSPATSASSRISLAPDRIVWGEDNKGAMVRVIGGAGRPGDAAGEPLRGAGREPVPVHRVAARLGAGRASTPRSTPAGRPTSPTARRRIASRAASWTRSPRCAPTARSPTASGPIRRLLHPPQGGRDPALPGRGHGLGAARVLLAVLTLKARVKAAAASAARPAATNAARGSAS